MAGVSGRSSSSGHSSSSSGRSSHASASHSSKSSHTAAGHSGKANHASAGHSSKANHAAKSPAAKHTPGAKHHSQGYHKDTFEGAQKKPAPQKAAKAHSSKPLSKDELNDAIGKAQKILAARGIPPSKMNAKDIAAIIQHESSGKPDAINLTDSNAKKGTPSIGLMQTIQPTFDKYKAPGHDNIRNPVDNIVAGVGYAVARYGSVSQVPGIKAMRSGHAYRGY